MGDTMAARARQGYRYLDHTADIGIEAWGADLGAAFTEAANGLAALMADPATVEETEEWRIAIDGDDRGDLLVRWLSELIALVDTDGVLLRRFEIDTLTDRRLEARVFGEALDMERHQVRTAVKAATYHALAVEPGPPARITVILDL